MARVRTVKLRVVMELTGEEAAVWTALDAVGIAARSAAGVQVSYPEPARVEPVIRRRKAKEA